MTSLEQEAREAAREEAKKYQAELRSKVSALNAAFSGLGFEEGYLAAATIRDAKIAELTERIAVLEAAIDKAAKLFPLPTKQPDWSNHD